MPCSLLVLCDLLRGTYNHSTLEVKIVILLNVDHMDSEAVIVNVLDFVYYMFLYLAPTTITQLVFNSNPWKSTIMNTWTLG